MHRRKWVCPDECAHSLYSKSAMIEHVIDTHSHNLHEDQISVYVDMCETEIHVTERDRCLICLKEMPLFQLQRHLARHMVEIALFVLPSPTEGVADGIMTDSDTEISEKTTQLDLFEREEQPDTLSSLEEGYLYPEPSTGKLPQLAPKANCDSTPVLGIRKSLEDDKSMVRSFQDRGFNYTEFLVFPTPPAARRLDYTPDLVLWYRSLQAEADSTSVDPKLVNLITEQVVAKLERSGTRQGRPEQRTASSVPTEPGRWPAETDIPPQDLSKVPPKIIARIREEIGNAIRKDKESWHNPTKITWSRSGLQHERELPSERETLQAQ